MSRKLRKAGHWDLIYIELALIRLHGARNFLKGVGAKKATDKVRRAIKSVEGAHRHARRCLTPP